MTDSKTDELKRLSKEARLGDLEIVSAGTFSRLVRVYSRKAGVYLTDVIDRDNAALIVAAVNALPELLAERDRLSAERDALKALCHEASEHYGYGGTFPIRGLMARRLIGAALGDWEPVRAALKETGQ